MVKLILQPSEDIKQGERLNKDLKSIETLIIPSTPDNENI